MSYFSSSSAAHQLSDWNFFAPPESLSTNADLLQINQTEFHCKVRDLYFSAWRVRAQLQQERKPPILESAWQGHKNPKVYEGDEVHCFNSYCQRTFRFSQQLVQHILERECGNITTDEILGLVSDWKALHLELRRCGKFTSNEESRVERLWVLLEHEWSCGQISHELISYLVMAWEILSGKRSM